MRHFYKEYPKEYYRLWWEYLRRSDRYKEYCLKFGTTEQYYHPDLDFTFNENGDVHRPPLDDFEQWYQFKKIQIEIEGHQKKTAQVKYLDEFIQARFQETVTHLSEKLGREPTIREFQEYFFDDLEITDTEKFVVTPGLFDTGKDIIDKVREWLKGRTIRKPTTRYDDLEKYLQIYDLKQQGQTVKEIVKERDLPGDAHTNEREYQRYIEKAREIIRNTEKNIFPGNYGQRK